MSPPLAAEVRSADGKGGIRFDRMEWGGAFGDLGTFIPFVVAYIAVVKVAPFGVLFSFGIAMVACGLYYRTPFPVQPMKAIGAVAATQAAQTAVITSSSPSADSGRPRRGPFKTTKTASLFESLGRSWSR